MRIPASSDASLSTWLPDAIRPHLVGRRGAFQPLIDPGCEEPVKVNQPARCSLKQPQGCSKDITMQAAMQHANAIVQHGQVPYWAGLVRPWNGARADKSYPSVESTLRAR